MNYTSIFLFWLLLLLRLDLNCEALAALELILWARLDSNSKICLPLRLLSAGISVYHYSLMPSLILIS